MQFIEENPVLLYNIAMKIATGWKDYEVLKTGDGEKLERWKDVRLLRPDPQVIWKAEKPLNGFPYDAHYLRSETGGGHWEYRRPIPEEWVVEWKSLRFKVKPMGFKHTGLFPEQAVNWERLETLIRRCDDPVNVLNLFAYTGGATVACAHAGAEVCHVDSAKNMVERAKENLRLSGLEHAPVRFIVDDCKKFVSREIRRGKRYRGLIMDPPSYGRGPSGEIWKIEQDLFDFVTLCAEALEKPAFVLINSYTTGLQPAVLNNILRLTMKKFRGNVESYEVCLPTAEGIVLPCGASGLWVSEEISE